MKRVILKENHIVRNNGIAYIEQYLNYLGINVNNIDSFINEPKDADEESPDGLMNIAAAAEMIVTAGKNNWSIFVQVDSDTDGYTSSSILINYLRRRFSGINIQWRLHNGKEHGVVCDTVPEDCDLVIIPDAGTNQLSEQEFLVTKGKKVIVLDHHESEITEFPNAIVVNNQLSPNFSNKSLSGAGVVYKLIKYIDKNYFNGDGLYKEYGDLAAVGIIADAMNMTNIDNNYIAYWGLANIHSKFLYEMAVRQSRGVKNPEHLTKIDVAFYIAPAINGVIRSGSPEDKEMVFRSLTEENNEEDFVREWRGTTYHETLYQCAARMACNAKARQDAAKKKSFEWLCEKIRTEGLDKNNIIIIALDEKESAKVTPNITGLIAMELVKEFNKPCLVTRKTEYDKKVVYGGSGRNGNFYNLPDLKQALHNSNEVYYAEGHANAFGVFIDVDKINNVVNYFNTNYDAEAFNDTVYEVDYWFHTGEDLDRDMLFEFATYDALWGNGIPQPKLAFDFNIRPSEVMLMGANKDSVKIKHENIDFVIFKNPDVAAQLSGNFETMHVQIIARPQMNEWMGRQNVQMIIDDLEILSAEEKVKGISLGDLI